MWLITSHGRRTCLIKRPVWNGKTTIIKQSQFACLFHNERGYTILNLLLTFFIYIFIISTVTIVFHFLVSQSQHPKDLKPFEWELFVIQLHKEIKESSDVVVNETNITFKNKHGQQISINKYKNLIRRQVGGLGHEIMLLKVKTATFRQNESGFELAVVSEAGKSYTHIFRSYKELVEI
ncbi:competence type IV pilus minor pilin ComGF [Metabacillus halosaccharovorans]|uniref:competence type IV pilus minor pilin ComGF n=1 Tax=Metabacillus halosaccharovorans TaxID=930124 RepID=UPI0009956516|nr:competence type IV pilus minor pilin ComGF [Metabacillus halosaccharovorans]